MTAIIKKYTLSEYRSCIYANVGLTQSDCSYKSVHYRLLLLVVDIIMYRYIASYWCASWAHYDQARQMAPESHFWTD